VQKRAWQKLRWQLVLILGFGLLSLYAANTVLGTLLPTISSQLSLNAFESGAILGVFGYAYAIMQLPVGYASDRYEPRKIVSISLGALFLSAFFFSLSTNFLQMFVARVAMGAAASFIYVDGLKTIEISYNLEERGRAIGVFTGLAYAGVSASNLLAGILLETTNTGWREIYQGTSLIVLLGSVLALLFVPRKLLGDRQKRADHLVQKYPELFKEQLWVVSKNKYFWIHTMISFVAFGSMFALIYWFPSYFLSKGFVTSDGAAAAGFIGLGSALGTVVFGFLADRWKERLPLIRGSLIAYMALLVLAVYVFSSPRMLGEVLAASFGLGFSQGGLTPNTRIIAELFPKAMVGTAFGVFNAATWIGSATFPLLVGYFVSAGLGYSDSFLVMIFSLAAILCLTAFSIDTGKSVEKIEEA
jgi:MFS family permease